MEAFPINSLSLRISPTRSAERGVCTLVALSQMRLPSGKTRFLCLRLKLAYAGKRHSMVLHGADGRIAIPLSTRGWMNLQHRVCRSRERAELHVVAKAAERQGPQGPGYRPSPKTAKQQEPHGPKAVERRGQRNPKFLEGVDAGRFLGQRQGLDLHDFSFLTFKESPRL